jgi:hypothetical protein
MLPDLDETLKQILIKKVLLEPSEVDISFEASDNEWAASISKPTADAFLDEIRNDDKLRNYKWKAERRQNKQAMHRG